MQDFEKHKKQFLFKIIKENILRGIKEGLFRKDIDVDIITWLQLELISGIFHDEEIASGQTSVSHFEKEMKDFFLHGVCTEKGLILFQNISSNVKKNQHEFIKI